MNIKNMRLIDEFAGVPLCAALSFLARARHAAGSCQHFHQLQAPKILIIHLSEMGAFVLAQPAIQELQRRIPQAELYFLVCSPIDELIQELNLAPKSRIFTIKNNNFAGLTASALRSVYRLRHIGIDAVINEEGFSRFAAILSYLSCPRGLRVGLHPNGLRSLYKGNLETHKVQYNSHIHASRSYLNLIGALWADPQDTPLLKTSLTPSGEIDVTPKAGVCPATWSNYLPLPHTFSYQPSPHSLTKIANSLQKRGIEPEQELIIVNPNSSDMVSHRCWPLENYEIVCRELLRRHPQAAIVVTGTAQESAGAHYLRTHVDGPIYDFTGDTNISELLALYTRCRLMITDNSGLAHLASIVGLPTIVLYGPETPLLFSPLSDKCCQLYANLACSPCISPYSNNKTACTRCCRCLTSLTPQHVLQAAEKVWQKDR
ncbi:MAG: glycosyltransferase family 9 protein [bacterium]|nr:glycosyltransferase family 9 protein [bacterium]